MLYERDYRILTESEKIKYEKVEAWYEAIKMTKSGLLSTKQLMKYWKDLPLATHYYKMLFPNNYISPDFFSNTSVISEQIVAFELLLRKKECNERAILNFIRTNRAYCLIAGIFNEFRTGHHEAFIFLEFPLPPNYIADYLLVGKGSGGYEFIFVELECPNGDITIAGGDFGSTIRKGIRQIEDWSTWIDGNFSNLKLVFEKYKSGNHSLPTEFINLDKSRIHFVVVAGRRTDFKEKTYRLKRKLQRQNTILLLHYDNLIDNVKFNLFEYLNKTHLLLS